MNDLDFGSRDKRGNWTPNDRLDIAPVFVFPPRPMAFLRWLPSYFFPWNMVWILSAIAWWAWVLPPTEVMAVLAWGWALKLFAVNCLAVFLFYGAFELQLYWRRAQGHRFKYNPKFPADHKSPAFLFQRQNVDSLIRGFGTGVPIWTAFEVLVLHAQAAGYVPMVAFADHPWCLVGVALLLPVLHEAHFFLIHRLIHVPVLYRWVHSVHHNSVNPSPWSSLSMHPVEHLLYFSTAAYHLLIPSNPVLLIYQMHMAGFGAVVGHVGFDKIEVTDEKAIDSHAYAHYLHHKYFEVNYGDGLIPFDRWFGTWHDGTRDGDALMQARYERKKAAANRSR